MAKKKTSRSASRHGQVAAGTLKQTLQVPKDIALAFREELASKGPQAVRFSRTGAIGLWLAIPEEVRDSIFEKIQHKRWADREEVTASEIQEEFFSALGRWLINKQCLPSPAQVAKHVERSPETNSATTLLTSYMLSALHEDEECA